MGLLYLDSYFKHDLFQLKQNGWIGNFALGVSYISLPWYGVLYSVYQYSWRQETSASKGCLERILMTWKFCNNSKIIFCSAPPPPCVSWIVLCLSANEIFLEVIHVSCIMTRLTNFCNSQWIYIIVLYNILCNGASLFTNCEWNAISSM